MGRSIDLYSYDYEKLTKALYNKINNLYNQNLYITEEKCIEIITEINKHSSFPSFAYNFNHNISTINISTYNNIPEKYIQIISINNLIDEYHKDYEKQKNEQIETHINNSI